MQEVIKVLKREISQERLYQTLSMVCRYHRIQTTRSYEAAAKSCVELLKQYGIEGRVLSYPMKEKTFVGSYRLFPEWNCKDGWCRLVEPKECTLADFKEDPIQIITQSISCDYRNQPLEIVDMDKGSEASAYEGVDLHGKLLFTHEQVKKYRWAFAKGAVGILSDYINATDFFRSSIDLPDIRNYTGFWWDYSEGEAKGFGYVLSPRLSAELKKLCDMQKQRYADGECDSPYPKAIAYMDTSIEEGHIEVVEATLPGKSKETILITAHLCHPYASANDNASGVSGAIETLIALKRSIERGALKPLEKTIKVILIPEFTGTYHYINQEDVSCCVAGINLDMIGAKQEGITGPITLTHLPYASPSIAGELASLLMEEIKQEPACAEDILFQNVLIKEEAFGLGSDHFILSDPQVHIPCVMLGQMPDLYYHTSGDTLARMDMAVLKYSTLLAASYVYLLSNPQQKDVEAIFDHQCTHLMKQIEQKKRMARMQGKTDEQLAKEMAVLKEFHIACANDMKQYVPDIDLIQKQCARIDTLIADSKQITKLDGTIYQRIFHDPIESLRSLFLEDPERREWIDTYDRQYAFEKNKALCEVLCMYWIDGKRSDKEIIQRVEAESGTFCTEMLEHYLELLKRLNLIKECV